MPIAVVNRATFNPTPDAGITHGQQINDSNTGYTSYLDPDLGRVLVLGDLTSQAGQTFSTNGQTITKKRFTSQVTVTGDNITFIGCLFGDYESVVIGGAASGTTLQYCTVIGSGTSAYEGILNQGASTTITRCDVSNAENCLTNDGGADNLIIEESYLHDPLSDDPGAHHDVIEIYGGSSVIIRKSRIMMTEHETAPINIASAFGDINGVDVLDNFIDGGNQHIIVDNQGSALTRVRVLRNKMGGHTEPAYARYSPLNNADYPNRAIVTTQAAQDADPEAILWPATGPDVNTWDECSDLTPDNTGVVISF